MTYTTYLIFVLLSLLLNIRNKGNLHLMTLVLFSFYFPTDNVTSWEWWWFTVFTLDLTILFAAMNSTSLASKPVFLVTCMMVLAHFLEYNTYVPSTYKFIMEYLEHLQMFCFILCAPNPIFYVKRKAKKWLRKYGYGF